MHPACWVDVLNAPAFVVNLDRSPHRLAVVSQRIRAAGFSDLRRFRAIDANNPADLVGGWLALGDPPFNPNDDQFVAHPGTQGCFLSHVLLWRAIVDLGLPFATVFEDDVWFHKNWDQLAPAYFHETPPDYDILFVGNMILNPLQDLVVRTDVWCMHAYVVTLEGARRLLDAVLKVPGGLFPVDAMLVHLMRSELYEGEPAGFRWYAWNGARYPDEQAVLDGGKPWRVKRNTGLVFQDPTLEGTVTPW